MGKRKGSGRSKGRERVSRGASKTFAGRSVARGGEGTKRAAAGFRVPSIVMIPVGLAVGWFVANWPGAIFGGVVGVFLWRSRA